MDRQECRVGICDDKTEDIAIMEDAVKKAFVKTGVPVHLIFRKYASGEALYEATQKDSFQLLLLDIEMPEMSGFELAERLCVGHPSFYMIFVSIHESYVFDASEYMPLWFVRKGNLEHDMFRAVRKYLQLTASTRVNYHMKKGFGFLDLPLRDILYIECFGHRLIIRKTDKTSLEKYGTLKAMEEELAGGHFLRIHKNYLVNQEYIQEVDKTEVFLTDGSHLDMGRGRRVKVQEEMLWYKKERYGNQ